MGKTALVYDVYCKPGGTEGEGEVVALKERLRNAVQEFETRWKSGGELGYVVGFSFFFPHYLHTNPLPRDGLFVSSNPYFWDTVFFLLFFFVSFPPGMHCCTKHEVGTGNSPVRATDKIMIGEEEGRGKKQERNRRGQYPGRSHLHAQYYSADGERVLRSSLGFPLAFTMYDFRQHVRIPPSSKRRKKTRMGH